MATTDTDPSGDMDAAMASADLLGQIAPPLRIRGGPDFILFERAPGAIPVAGATLWLQNPTNAPMEVRAWIAFDSAPAKVAVPDRFVGTLAPLEVGVLAVPVSITFRVPYVLKFGLMGRSAAARVRATTPGSLDREATAKGILFGLAGVALTGVGHFRITHVGGDVGSGFSASWDFSGADPAIVGAEATWTRVWAPRDAPDTVFVHSAAPPRAIETNTRIGNYVAVLAAFVVAIIGYNIAAPVVGVVPAIVLAAVVFMAAGYAALALLKIALPGLVPAEVIGSLVLRDGVGVTRA